MKLWPSTAVKPAVAFRWVLAAVAIVWMALGLAFDTFQHDLLAAAPNYDRPEATIYALPIPAFLLAAFWAGRCWRFPRRLHMPVAAVAAVIAAFRTDIVSGRWDACVEWTLGAAVGLLLAVVFCASRELAEEARNGWPCSTRTTFSQVVALVGSALGAWYVVYTTWTAPYAPTHLVTVAAAVLPLTVACMGSRLPAALDLGLSPVTVPVVFGALFLGARVYLLPVGDVEASLGLTVAWVALGVVLVWAANPFVKLVAVPSRAKLEQALGLGTWLVLALVGAFASITYAASGALKATGWDVGITMVPALGAWRMTRSGRPFRGSVARSDSDCTLAIASMPRRIGAWLIDGFLAWMATSAIVLALLLAGWTSLGGLWTSFLVVSFFPTIGMAALEVATGRTPGGLLCGIQLLVDDDADHTLGMRVGPLRGMRLVLLRRFLIGISSIAVFVPFALLWQVLTDDRGRSWLDKRLGVVVVRASR